MSLLDQLWDDTLAGPPPDKGLGKLRKYPTFGSRSSSSNSPKPTYQAETVNTTATAAAADDSAMRITRSIMIVKPDRNPNQSETPPASPAGSTPPVSPFAAGGRLESFRFRRRSTSDAYEKASGIGARSPRPPYDI